MAKAQTDFPNVFRSFVSDPFNNSPLGTLSIRRTFTNNTGTSIDRLRFRIVDLTTFPAVSGIADLRVRTSSTTLVPITGGAAQTVAGTALEPGRPVQVFGGGFNSSVSVNTVTPDTPLANGASISLQFLLGVQQTGCYRFAVVAESLPEGGSNVFLITGETEGGAGACADPPLLTSSVAVTSLRRSKSDLFNVGLSASGNGSTVSVAVFGDEDDETPTSPNKVHSPDAKDIAPGTLRLRAERTNAGDGRVYLIVVTATNVFGNSSRNCHTVVVPKKKEGDTDAQAAAARAFCEANAGLPPPGYFVIGDGPIIGPKQ